MARALNRLAFAIIVPSLLLMASACASGGAAAWKKGEAPTVTPATQGGFYDLVAGKDRTVARYQVQQGEPLGFQKNNEGRVEAVAGLYTVPLNSTKTYQWRLSKEQ